MPAKSLIEAFLLDQPSAFQKLIQSVAQNETSSSHLRLLGRFLEMKERDDGYLLYPQVETEIYDAIKNPPDDPKLFTLLIAAFTFFYVYSPQRSNAASLISYLERYEKEDLESDHYILIQFVKWIFHRIHRDYVKELESIDKILSRVHPRGSPLWLFAKTNRIESALLHQDLALAKKELGDLEPFRDTYPWYGLGPYEFMSAWLAFGQGKNEEMLSYVENYPLEKMGRCKTKFFIYQIRTLINLERLTEAEKLLDNAKADLRETTAATLALHRNLTTADYENLRGFLELAKRNFNAARTHAQQSIKIIHSNTLQSDGTLAPGFSNAYGKFCLLFVELATKQARAARLLLQALDPQQEKHVFEWARLRLLEGNRDHAMLLFKKFMTKSPQALESKLQFAFELSPVQVASILTNLPSISKKDIVLAKTAPKKIGNSTLISSVFIGNSTQIQDIKNKIEQFALLNSTILISGETGCGKDVVARLLHQSSPQASEPFIPVNCGALSETLIESELFGHVKGAFTGANADHQGIFLAAGKGTVFLDEISSMSPHLQASLLRVLENQEIRPVGSNKIHRIKARVIVATNEPLDKAVSDKKFRIDLYFRLAHFHIHIPPLRERREDIPLLAEYFLKNFYADIPVVIGNDLAEALKRYDWPGNVRELKNEMERIAFLAGDSQTLDASLFQHDERGRPSFSTPSSVLSSSASHAPSTGEKLNYAAFRLQRLRNLFDQHSKLSRLDVIRLLHYAPATVAKDLKILEQEKWIRRINTSAHPRTSYFVKC
jgi:transcriptional regulator with GAF, ATPase, and Fis domain